MKIQEANMIKDGCQLSLLDNVKMNNFDMIYLRQYQMSNQMYYILCRDDLQLCQSRYAWGIDWW